MIRRTLPVALAALAIAPAAAVAHGSPRVASGPEETTTSRTATFVYEYHEPGPLQHFECQLDAGPWEECGDFGPGLENSGTITYEGLSLGEHSFSVRRVSGVPSPLTPFDVLSDSTPTKPYLWTVVA